MQQQQGICHDIVEKVVYLKIVKAIFTLKQIP